MIKPEMVLTEANAKESLPFEIIFLECPYFSEDEVESQIFLSETLCDSPNTDHWRRKRK